MPISQHPPTDLPELITLIQLRVLRGESPVTGPELTRLLAACPSGSVRGVPPEINDPPSAQSVTWALSALMQAWNQHDPWAAGKERQLMSRHAGLQFPVMARRIKALQEQGGVFINLELEIRTGIELAFLEGAVLGAACLLTLQMLTAPPDIGGLPALSYLEHPDLAPQLQAGLSLAQALDEHGTDTKAQLFGSPDESDLNSDPRSQECGGGDHPVLARQVWREHFGELVREANWRSDIEFSTIYWPELYGRQSSLGEREIASADLGTLLARLWPAPLDRRYHTPDRPQVALQRSRRQRVPHPYSQSLLRADRGDAFTRRLLLASRALATSQAGSRWLRLGPHLYHGSPPGPQTLNDLRALLSHPLWQTEPRQEFIQDVLSTQGRA